MSQSLSHGDRPLGSYAAAIGVFLSLSGSFGIWFRRSGRSLPERIDPRDMALLAVASAKTARLISRDRVTTPLRAPFTVPQGDAGHGEVDEKARGSGPRLAVGQMLICPHCLGLWTTAAFTAGLLAVPRLTRCVASLMSIVFVADALQFAYRQAEDAT